MSRAEADGPTSIMIECLGAVGPIAHPLVIGEPSGRLGRALRDLRAEPRIWLRHAVSASGQTARAWPDTAPCDAAMVRLPKAKDALSFALHAAAASTPAGAPVLVFGANSEGIKSAAARMAEIADDVTTLLTRHHARVLRGRRKCEIPGLKGSLAAWREVREIEIAGARRRWSSYPGTFAKGGLDDGTALLLRHLPEPGHGARVLDFAAGTGVIAAAVIALAKIAGIDMLEADAVAVAAAAENVPEARAILGDSLAALGDQRYDLIVSNPPFHDGVAESRAVLDRLIAHAPAALRPGGRLVLVVQRRMPVLRQMQEAFAEAAVVADDGRFTVVSGVVGRPQRG